MKKLCCLSREESRRVLLYFIGLSPSAFTPWYDIIPVVSYWFCLQKEPGSRETSWYPALQMLPHIQGYLAGHKSPTLHIYERRKVYTVYSIYPQCINKASSTITSFVSLCSWPMMLNKRSCSRNIICNKNKHDYEKPSAT